MVLQSPPLAACCLPLRSSSDRYSHSRGCTQTLLVISLLEISFMVTLPPFAIRVGVDAPKATFHVLAWTIRHPSFLGFFISSRFYDDYLEAFCSRFVFGYIRVLTCFPLVYYGSIPPTLSRYSTPLPTHIRCCETVVLAFLRISQVQRFMAEQQKHRSGVSVRWLLHA